MDNYYWQPCKTEGQVSLSGKARTAVVRCEHAEAEFFGVYRRFEDGSSSWLPDFSFAADAVGYCYDRNKEANE